MTRIAMLPLSLLATAGLIAQTEGLRVQAGLKSTQVDYGKSAPRDLFTSLGTFVDVDHLDWLGVGLGVDRDRTRLVSESTVPQTNLYGQVRFYIPLGGRKLILRGDGLRLTREPGQGSTGTTSVVGYHLGWLSDRDPPVARVYVDAAHHRSTYTSTFQVDQWTPTLGLGFNGNTDWFTLAGTRITVRDATTIAKDPLTSMKVPWTHFFLPDVAWKPASFGASITGGRRIYEVTPEAGHVVNHGETQTGGWSLDLGWKFKTWSLGLYGGRSKWETTTGSTYNSTALSTVLTYAW